MIYDFVDDSNLDKKIKNNFKKKLLSEFNNFSNYLSLFSNKYKKSLDWWVSLPASRNNFTSDIYYNFCICEFIKEELNKKKKINKILINNIIIKKILIKIIKNFNVEVEIKLITKKKKKTIFTINFFYELGYLFFFNLTKYYSAKKSRKNTINNHNNVKYNKDPLTLIDTFLLPKYINDDRYYNNLTENISDNNKNIYFIPTVVITNKKDLLNLNSIYKNIRGANRKFLVKEDYINIFDIFYSLLHYYRLLKLKKYKFNYNNIDYSSLIYSELYFLSNFSMSLEAILNFRFIKKLKSNKINIKYFINWWENQPLDKSLNLALKLYYNKTKVIGYLGYVPRNYELNIFPVDNEIESNVIPDSISVIGKGYINEVSKLSQKLKVNLFPALRFEHLWKNIKSKLNYEYIFVPLPILLNESNTILNLVLNSFKYNKFNIKILVKPHPAISKECFINKFDFPEYLSFTSIATDSLIHNAKIVLSGVSSICMESICLGIPTIIIESNKCMNFDPIPNKLNLKNYKRISNHKDLSACISYFLSLSVSQRELIKKDSENIKDRYFEKPTNNNKIKMLNL